MKTSAIEMHFIVTAGPTREYLDPVRFLSNPSSGRMGFAVARAARQRRHRVTLIAGPVALRTPQGVARLDVVSARDMLAAVETALAQEKGPAALVMTAAVADWRPARQAAEKLKKSAMSGTLALARNPDILLTLAKRLAPADRARVLRVGFAAETGDPRAEALRKCRAKDLDFVVANDVTAPDAGFGVKTNRATFVFPDGETQALALMTKDALARNIVRTAEKLAKDRGNT